MKKPYRIAILFTVTALVFASAVVRFSSHDGDSQPPMRAAVTSYPDTYGSVQEFMEGIYAADRLPEPDASYRVRAVVVPHHLLASASIATGIRALKGQPFSKILLLSPDHFHRCPTTLCTVEGNFSTAFGEARADVSTVGILRASPLVTEDATLFEGEHGITAVLPFMTHYFPGLPVTPLVLSQRPSSASGREAALSLLESAIEEDTMLVVSSDFSHYLPLATANEKDELTAQALFAKDIDGIAALENPTQSDCPGCLWLLASLADRGKFYNPSVLAHTNSAEILSDARVTETTSHFAIAWLADATLDESDFAVAGDVTVTRGPAMPLPDAMARWWSGDGVRLANLEGPLAIDCPARANPYVFCNPLASWGALKDLATLWGTENNHRLDLGEAGYRETIRLLDVSGEQAAASVPWEDGHIRVVTFAASVNPVAGAVDARVGAAWEAGLRALRKSRADTLTVAYVHGGEEYRALATDAETRLWEGLIDAGADAVIVSHSHMPGDVRIYRGKPIFRGLGNFVFDQRDRVATSTAKLVRLRKTGDRVLFETLLHRIP